MADREVTVLRDGFAFPECPRWHDGRLWFSDMHDGKVWAMTQHAQAKVVCEVPGQPAGLGWLPDGTLQVVSMTDRRLLRLVAGGLEEVADLSPFFTHHANDMVMDARGRAYVGTFGFDLDGGDEPTTTIIVCVEPDGTTWPVIDELLFPNGSVITADGSTLVVAESFGQRLSAYTLHEDGSVSDPRVWADLRPNVPDGICIDAAGGVWVADPVQNGLLRVEEGGLVTEWIDTPDLRAYACALGGGDGQTLYICTASTSNPSKTVQRRDGAIAATRVEVPGVGLG